MKITTLLLTSALLATSLTVSADSKEYVGLIGPVVHYNMQNKSNISNDIFGLYYRTDEYIISMYRNSFRKPSIYAGMILYKFTSKLKLNVGIANNYSKSKYDINGYLFMPSVTFTSNNFVFNITSESTNISYEININ